MKDVCLSPKWFEAEIFFNKNLFYPFPQHFIFIHLCRRIGLKQELQGFDLQGFLLATPTN